MAVQHSFSFQILFFLFNSMFVLFCANTLSATETRKSNSFHLFTYLGNKMDSDSDISVRFMSKSGSFQTFEFRSKSITLSATFSRRKCASLVENSWIFLMGTGTWSLQRRGDRKLLMPGCQQRLHQSIQTRRSPKITTGGSSQDPAGILSPAALTRTEDHRHHRVWAEFFDSNVGLYDFIVWCGAAALTDD